MTERPVSWLMIEPGWAVVAVDGAEVGRIKQVLGDENADIFDGLAVTRGTGAAYVPSEHVGEITAGSVALTIDRAAVDGLDPYEPPPPVEQVLPESASLWERFTSWFR